MPLNELVTDDSDFEVADNQPAAKAETPAREASPAPAERATPDADDFETGEPEVKPEEKPEEQPEQKGRKRSLEGRKQTIQEQINELVREKGTTQRERDAIKAETERLRAERDAIQREIQEGRPRERQQPDGRQPATAGEQDPAWGRTSARDPEPQEDQFDDFGAYVRAQSNWAAREAVRVQNYRQGEARERGSRAQFEQQRQEKFAGRYQEFAKANPTFEAEVNREDLGLTAPMVDVIKDSEVGPQLMLHLVRNPDEVDRLAAMHPVLAYGEMKKHEARLEAAHSGSAQAKTPQLSKARPPIKPVDSAGAASDDGELPDDLDMDEHIERGNALDKRRRQSGQRA